MADFVLDCSVAAAWCFEDEAEGYADRVLEAFDRREALAPQLLLLELGNVLVVAERQDQLREKEMVRFISLIRSLPIQVTQWLTLDLTQSMIGLARDNELSVYDANYLWIAMQEDLPVATLDQSLRQVCEKKGVSLFDPS